MNVFSLQIDEQDVAEAVRLIEAGWTPETDDNQPYAVEIDFKEELKASGITPVETPVFKLANGQTRNAKTYVIYDVECPPPPKIISSYLAAIKPYVFASVLAYCKRAGITHVHNVEILRHGTHGLVAPFLHVWIRAYRSKPTDNAQASKEEIDNAKRAQESMDTMQQCVESIGKIKEAANLQGQGSLLDGIKEAAEKARIRIVEHVQPYNPKDLSISNTWYYHMDNELVPHPVNYLTGQWLYDRLANKVGADGTHFIFAVDDKAKRLAKVDRPEKMNLSNNTWAFFAWPANAGIPTYNDYLHEMHMHKVAEANERHAKKDKKPDFDAQDAVEAEKLYIRQDRTVDYAALFNYMRDKAESHRDWGRVMVNLPIGAVLTMLRRVVELTRATEMNVVKAKDTCKRCKSACTDMSSGLCVKCLAQDAHACQVKLGQIEHVMSGHVQWIQNMQSIWKREEGQK